MRTFTFVLLIAVVVGLTTGVPSAETSFAVIVNAKNPTRSLDKKTASDVFLKKRTQWSDETVILPVDQRRTAAVRRQFSETVHNRSVDNVRTYWNRQVFSGRNVPPPELESDEAVIGYVAKHPGAIGYVSAGANLKDASVKTIEVR